MCDLMENPEAAEGDTALPALIAAQNDRFRATWGADFTVPGRIVLTPGVVALGYDVLVQIMVAIQSFADFTEANDPSGQHDFGAFFVTYGGEKVKLYWKIDLYDPAYAFATDDAADVTKTRRLLTVLLPSEY